MSKVSQEPPKAKEPSKVELTSFAVYKKKKGEIDLLRGGSSARKLSDGRFEITLGSVPIRKGLQPPENGLLMLYGFQDRLQEEKATSEFAYDHQAELVKMILSVEVGEIVPKLISLEELREKKLRFANFRRFDLSLQRYVLDAFAKYVAQEGRGLDGNMNLIAQIASRPDLFARLIQDDRAFQHFEVLVIPVSDNPTHPEIWRQVAYIRPNAKIVQRTTEFDSDILVLPANFKPNAKIPKLPPIERVAPLKAAAPASKKTPVKQAKRALPSKAPIKRVPVKAPAKRVAKAR
jgi:hypothetical protein